MHIGDLKHSVTLQYSTRVADGMGGFATTWNDAATVYAAIWPVSAKETVQAMGQAMTITHRIRMRYRANIRSSWRIKHGNRYYNIVSIINPNMERKWLDILVKEAA